MINSSEIIETIKMIEEQNLDIRTITMGINLLDCANESSKIACEKYMIK